MNQPFVVVANYNWLLEEGSHQKRLKTQDLCPVGGSVGHLSDGCRLLVKNRSSEGAVSIDPEAKLIRMKGEFFIKSRSLSAHLTQMPAGTKEVLFYFEGDQAEARVIVQEAPVDLFSAMEEEDPTLRLHAFDLPPWKSSVVSENRVADAIYDHCAKADKELYAVHVSGFLDGPHILVPLFNHVLSLRSDDHIKFPIVLKKVAEQLRVYLTDHGKTVTIQRIEKDHSSFWQSTAGQRYAFLDGGVARIPTLATLEPMALRVGIYDVAPGDVVMETREKWSLAPYVLGDIVDRPPRGIRETTDRKRLQEAARYILEPLTGLGHLVRSHGTSALFIHGPLVNQFTMYDEGEPNNLPSIAPEFLEKLGITRSEVMSTILDIPVDPRNESLWNQFMAIYGFVTNKVVSHSRPIVGVVERPTGRPVATAVLAALVEDRVINRSASKAITDVLSRFDISDDFLFGCVLKEGEYLTPLPVSKNAVNRARDRWRLVVAQYPSVYASLVKTEGTRFPFRVEMNTVAAEEHSRDTISLLYHTARLLPQYAFPVGLDIVDKYAKIPDWLSRGISAELSSAILRRAIKTGDPQLVSQVRQLLSGNPRDFFYRPGIN